MSESTANHSEPNPELKEVLMRLHEHATGTVDFDPLNLSDFVMRVTDNLGNANPIALWDNLVIVLEQLNTLLNKNEGESKSWFDLTYPGPIVYDINGMVAGLLICVVEHKCTKEEAVILIRLAWRISMAWSAILGTDCESVTEFIDLEEHTRGINDDGWQIGRSDLPWKPSPIEQIDPEDLES